MKDHFSIQSSAYAQFRPHYPDEMIAHVASFAKTKVVALDVATGNGQVANKLSAYFQMVYATDISQSQLQKAIPASNVVYKVEAAERTDFADRQFDLITVAQAVHWFKFDAFYQEVYRILKPDGVFAVLGYGLFSTNPDSDAILMDYYHHIVGPYWDAERQYIDQKYETIPFPFNELETCKFTNEFNWTFDQLVGYLHTWSATQSYKNKMGNDPVQLIRDDLKQSWENSDKRVAFPLLLRVGTLKNKQP
ncbi:class I SAM-dependent methyltransferase [Flavobacterium sp.]|uniref:class I SAM-dependent methyltransferase n=1 Tax=Flavobacterium sp. TaxID=239 RepID=UPI0039E6E408